MLGKHVTRIVLHQSVGALQLIIAAKVGSCTLAVCEIGSLDDNRNGLLI